MERCHTCHVFSAIALFYANMSYDIVIHENNYKSNRNKKNYWMTIKNIDDLRYVLIVRFF